MKPIEPGCRAEVVGYGLLNGWAVDVLEKTEDPRWQWYVRDMEDGSPSYWVAEEQHLRRIDDDNKKISWDEIEGEFGWNPTKIKTKPVTAH